MSQITEEQRATLGELAKGYVTVDHPTPILETPADYEMEYEDVRFNAEDGVELAAWFIPAEGSDKLIICNHPATFNGLKNGLDPLASAGIGGCLIVMCQKYCE